MISKRFPLVKSSVAKATEVTPGLEETGGLVCGQTNLISFAGQ
jgi:hypothetical protein